MRIEIPELKRCCCFLPLRRGLLLWIYLTLVFEIGYLILCIKILTVINSLYMPIEFDIALLIIDLVLTLIDMPFCVLFIISAHKKNLKHIRIYYRYVICMLIVGVIIELGTIGMEIFKRTDPTSNRRLFSRTMVELACFTFANLVLRSYLVLLLRSEIRKLKRSAQFEFENRTSQPECQAQIVM